MFNNVLMHIAGGRFAVLLLLFFFVLPRLAGASRVSFEEDELERILKATFSEKNVYLSFFAFISQLVTMCHPFFQFIYQN